MQVYHSLHQITYIGNVVVTIGNFDGVHLGHVKLLSSLLNEHRNGLESMVVTFWPHPRTILEPISNDLKFLCSVSEKAQLLKQIGIKHLLIVPFTLDFSEVSAYDFLKSILVDRVGIKKVVLGYDNHFGKGREGNVVFLKKFANQFGYEVQEIPKQEVDHLAISSSQIRKDLLVGHLKEAEVLLGRPYSISGWVVEGNKLGRTIGFPTANLRLDFDGKLVPRSGVYAVKAIHGHTRYSAVMNIGYRPTVGGNTLSLEVHIFDFVETIYGDLLTVEFIAYIRPEQKFASLGDLKDQLFVDSAFAKKLLAKHD